MQSVLQKEFAMKIFSHEILLETFQKTQFIDLTEQLQKFVKDFELENGFVNVFSLHTTGAIIVNENEPGLLNDLKRFFEKLAPNQGKYEHDDLIRRNLPADEPINGHSHLRQILLGSNKTFPIFEGKLKLGRWQSVFFVELDGPRKRKVLIQGVGK